MIQPERIRALNERPVRDGRHVLYWMEASCRAACNHALEHAVREANRLGRPLIAGVALPDARPGLTARHCTFQLEGLRDVRRALARRGIPLIVRRGAPDAVAATLARGACLVVTDRGYLRHQRAWRARAAERLACALIEVESDVIVPVESAMPKEAYAAATLRPRLHRLLPKFLVPLRTTRLRHRAPERLPASLDLADIPRLVRALGADPAVPPVPGLRGGATAARRRLAAFLRTRLARYAGDRNDPARDGQSGLSPYLHFGHLSPLEIALAVRLRRGPGVAAFREELIVRRELSMNFTHYHERYDRFECLPAWCRATLERHARDPRDPRYPARELEAARTHDPYWNAAQQELVLRGRIHGYLRMYWGKKILEWTERPQDAFALAVRLNDRYALDGCDPNGYAGVAWCFGKHDRPWTERPIFGLVRYMNANGLRRKFDIDAYVRRIAALARPSGAHRPARFAPPSELR